ncbi:MAG: ATPase domain-containing protein [Gemmatimonadota bacterium]|jgi:KaiC/GvpD/RAD55 family RecA-like ATPase
MKTVTDNQTPTPAERKGRLRVVSGDSPEDPGIPFGIDRLDDRLGGLQAGGHYLLAGRPGPAKFVALLQFLHKGISLGERTLLLTSADPTTILHMARAWGCSLDEAWYDGQLEILGFQSDFEMRVLRSAEPQDAIAELDGLAEHDVARIAVSPGALFLLDGPRTLLSRIYLAWALRHPATVCTTLSVDGNESLPSTTEWLVQATSGVLFLGGRTHGLYEVRMHRALPEDQMNVAPVSLQLRSGRGLTAPERFQGQRKTDRPAGEADHLLLVALGKPDGSVELEAWASEAFNLEVVHDPMDAMELLRSSAAFGGIVVHTRRESLGDAVKACRVLRPLTGGAIIVTTDDAVRSTDRLSLLEAGADDCMSGGIDFRELGARIHQAVAAGGKAIATVRAVRDGNGLHRGGSVSPEEFAREAGRRAGDPRSAVFSLIRITAEEAGEEVERLLVEEIRDEEGDLVSSSADGFLVLLQGARREPAEAFVKRVGKSYKKSQGHRWSVSTEVLVHPAEKSRIEDSGWYETSGPNRGGPGGSSGQTA